jgi:two-component system NarL family sensor kinase
MKNKTFRLTMIITLLLMVDVLQSQTNEKKIEYLIDDFARTLSSNPDSAFFYIKKATHESKEIDNSFLLSRCYYNLGYFYYLKKDLEQSKSYTLLSLPYAEKEKNYKIIALNYNQLGLIYKEESNYIKALENFLQSLNIAEKNNLKKNESITLINLGSLYEIQNDTLKALQYYKKSQDLAFKNGLKSELLASYNNLAILQFKTNKEKSIENYNKAYAISIELNDKYEQFNILINLSDIYSVYKNKTKIDYSFKYLFKAKKIAQELSDERLLFYVFFNLGGCYKNVKNYKASIESYLKADQLSKKGISDDQRLSLLRGFELVYKESGNFNQAYNYKEKHNVLKDSLFSVQKNKVFNEIQTKYEVEKKNLKIDLLSKEKQIEKVKKRVVLYISIAIVLALSSLLLFYKNRIKLQKIINEKEQQLFAKQKIELEQQQEIKHILGMIEGQDQERNRVAKEIHDGVGGDLAGIKLQLYQINNSVKSESIKEVINQITNVFDDLRNISHDLSLNTFIERSLESLIFELKIEYESRNQFAIELLIFPNNALESFSESLKKNLYRILQELLANVSKHANAKNILISFTRDQNQLNLIFEDDGSGFESKKSNGIGMKNIEERLVVINGKMTIDSKLKRGTSIFIEITLADD